MNSSGTRLFRPNDRIVQRASHRFVLSMIFSGLAIALLFSVLWKQIPPVIEKTRLVSTLMSPVSTGRIKVIEHHAVTGDWLSFDEATLDAECPTTFVSAEIGHFRQGAIHIEVRNRKVPVPSSEWWSSLIDTIAFAVFNQFPEYTDRSEDHNEKIYPALLERWTIRPAIMSDDAPTVLWVCGSRPPPEGFQAFGEDLTTIPPEENFWLCR